MENQSETQSSNKTGEGRARGQTGGEQETEFSDSYALNSARFGRSLGSQAAILRGLKTPQRQAVMREISHIQGNQHVLRLLSSFNATVAPGYPVVQRQIPGETTSPSCSQTDPMAQAIDLFAASATAATPLGAAVLARLRELQPEGELAYGPLVGQHGHTIESDVPGGTFIGRLGRPDITVSDSHSHDTVATALTLVHEGNHHVQEGSTIEEEMQSFELEAQFYADLRAGITMCGVRYQAQPGEERLRDWEVAYDAYQRNQLVDVVCADYHESVTPAWIMAHMNDWGGLTNRQDRTRGLFIQVLCRQGDPPLIWPQVLQILESFHSRAGYDSIVGSAGAIDEGSAALNVQRGEELIRTMFAGSYILYARDVDLARLHEVEARFGVHLGPS